jgi:hypothetical protein
LFGTVVDVVVVAAAGADVVVAVAEPFGTAVITGVDTTGIWAWPTATVVAGAADVLGAFTTMSSAGATVDVVVVEVVVVVVVVGTALMVMVTAPVLAEL